MSNKYNTMRFRTNNGSVLFLVLIIGGIFSSCLDPYNPPAVTAPNSFLVVEGILGDRQSYVRLSRTVNLAEVQMGIENGANIVVEDENGNEVGQLFQNENGQYVGEPNLLINNSYRVRINTADDATYVSDYVAILPTPDIDSVGFDIEDDGIQLHVSTNDPEDNTQYYRWDFTETWQYNSTFASIFVWEDDTLKNRDLENDQIFRCWSTRESTEILVGSTVRLAENRIFKAPVAFINPQASPRLSSRYSILVRQYALTQEAFEFWDVLKRNSESLGTFFDPQPSQLTSNVINVDDPSEPVIGWVSGAQVKEERKFILRSEVPFTVLTGRPASCDVDTLALDIEEWRGAFEDGFLLPVEEVFSEMGGVIGISAGFPNCVDCRVRGGTNQMPDFW